MPIHYQPPLLLELKPSAQLQYLMAALHLLAMFAAIANALGLSFKLALCAGICLNFALFIKRTRTEKRKIKYDEASGFEFSDGGEFMPVTVLGSSVITSVALCLHLKNTRNKRHTALVLSDSLCEDSYRHLIVQIKTVMQYKSPHTSA